MNLNTTHPHITSVWKRVNHYSNIRRDLVSTTWVKTNPEGLMRFTAWFWEHYKPMDPQIPLEYVGIRRKDDEQRFWRHNCELFDTRTLLKSKDLMELSDGEVINLRRFVKKNPTAALQDVAMLIEKDLHVVSKAVMGMSHVHLNKREAPYVSRRAVTE